MAKTLKKPKVDQVAKMRERGFLTAREIAEKLGNNIATVYRWQDEGLVSGTTIGNRRYLSLASVVKHIGQEAAVIFGLIAQSQPKAEVAK